MILYENTFVTIKFIKLEKNKKLGNQNIKKYILEILSLLPSARF